MSLKGIVNGYTNSALDSVGVLGKKKQEVANARMSVCKLCTTFDTDTNVCMKDKGGCGCLMTKKVYSMDSKCPLGKWGPANLK
tara:strand:+ start:359 stop:607 length:249 start_codon:yes stop_codon:yes gene_type:complete